MKIYKFKIKNIAFTFIFLIIICLLIYLKEESRNKEVPKKATLVLNIIEEGFWNE